MQKMNPEIKPLWLAALRSGNYKQGNHLLHDVDGNFCCLGVLCDIVKDRLAEEWALGNSLVGHSFLGSTSTLPQEVVTLTGVTFTGRFGPDDDSIRSLTVLNDRGTSFSNIADLIEKHL